MVNVAKVGDEGGVTVRQRRPRLRPPVHATRRHRPGRRAGRRTTGWTLATIVAVAAVLTTATTAMASSSSHSGAAGPGAAPVSAAYSYDLVTALGFVETYGGAGFYGDLSADHLSAPIVAMAVTPDGKGYWLAAADGTVYAFGNAHSYGDLSGEAGGVGQAIVTIVATPDGKGYWLVDASGAVAHFGDAPAINGGRPLPARQLLTPVVSAAIASNGSAAWFTDAAGHVYGAGDAQWFGSRAGKRGDSPVDFIALAPGDDGYWLADAAGDVWGYSDAATGATAPAGLSGRAVGLVPAENSRGYWLATSSGVVLDGGDAPSRGGTAGEAGLVDVVAISAAPRVAPSPLPADAVGYDINWPQCASSGSPQAGTLPGPPRDAAGSAAYSIAVVGVDGWAVGDDNPCLAPEVAWAKGTTYPAGSGNSGTPPYDLYLFLNSPAPGSTIDRTGPKGTCDTLSGKSAEVCLSYNYGYNAAVGAVAYGKSQGARAKIWWLDIENASCAPGMWNDANDGEWWSCDLALNDETIQGALDALRSLGITPGIYCTNYQWAGITGSYMPTGGAPLIWIAGAVWTSPPYPHSYGFPKITANNPFCTESKYRFAGGRPVMLQETPGGNNYPYDPDVSC